MINICWGLEFELDFEGGGGGYFDIKGKKDIFVLYIIVVI